MKMTRYDERTIGKVVSLRCRRSLTNRNVVVIDNEKIDQVYLYEYATIDEVITYLQDVMNIDIRAARQSPLAFKLVNHQSPGDVYQISHEEDDSRDDFHAFFAPLEDQ